MDESAHDWTHIRMGRARGWNGVALKTCKTQTGAILSLCWAKAHGMTLMVQDLTNPMLAGADHAPVVGALVHEQRLAGRDAAHVEGVGLQVVGERLLDVEDH